MYRSHVLVCGGTGCTSSGSQQIMEALKEEIKKQVWKMRFPLFRPAVTACAHWARL